MAILLRRIQVLEGILRVVAGVLLAVVAFALQPRRVVAGRLAGAAAQAGATCVDPASAAAEVGDDITVDVVLSDGAAYYGLEFQLSFDPDVVTVSSAQVDPVWEVFDAEHHWIVRNDVDNVSGTVHFAVTNLHPAEPFSGTGRVCTITFTALAPGRTPLHLSGVRGATHDGAALSPTSRDGQIVVSSGGAIQVRPPSVTVEQGQQVTTFVWLSEVIGYYGLEFDLSFDPDVVTVSSGQVEPAWEVFDAEHHWIVRNEIDNVSGTVHYAVTNVHPAEPFSGTGQVCGITFTGLDPGHTTLEITQVAGATRDGEPLDPATADGEIVVIAAPTPPDGYPVGGATLPGSLRGAVLPRATLAALVILGAMSTVLGRILTAQG
ncbi:MAG: cohesin domain-containing protein [Anaerolineae bacterium]